MKSLTIVFCQMLKTILGQLDGIFIYMATCFNEQHLTFMLFLGVIQVSR